MSQLAFNLATWDGDSPEWVTGLAVDRSGVAAFVHLVRAPDDPPEAPRGSGSERRKLWGVAPHVAIEKRSRDDWRQEIVKLMVDGKARTFNAICVTLTGLTADVCFGLPPDGALWMLVEEQLLEHTLTAPVLFRWRTP